MGVPAFYRWLSEKYPKIVSNVAEERVRMDAFSHQPMPLDWRGPNPSGLECDNLYIDMNGIIHPCSHPENGPQPATEQEMFENVCKYVDRLVRAVRPRRLLYLAVDGVAPRAKMNQQRARRFRAAEEARELAEIQDQVRSSMGKQQSKKPAASSAWDSNVITPGTKFMTKLSDYLRFYIRKRLQEDPSWKHLIIIWSDASIPGEGEHKLMAHLRRQRSQPGYDPNAVHVLHGLDADLIMLGLATHEAHFYVCREQVLFGRKSVEMAEQRQLDSGHKDQQEQLNQAVGAEAMGLLENQQTPLQRISIPILREYLQAEFEECLRPEYLSFAPSLERLIDDIVFLCFFVGNDFLPHLPSLDIRDGGLDFLFNVYKRILPSLGDYITKSGGNVNLSHVDVILSQVGALEDYVFAMKHESEERNKKFQQDRKARDKQQGGRRNNPGPPPEPTAPVEHHARKGRSSKILGASEQTVVPLSRKHGRKDDTRQSKKIKHMEIEENTRAALALKQSLTAVSGAGNATEELDVGRNKGTDNGAEMLNETATSAGDSASESQYADAQSGESMADESVNRSGSKRKHEQVILIEQDDETAPAEATNTIEAGAVGDAELYEDGAEFCDDDIDVVVDDDELEDNLPKLEEALVEELDPETARVFKDKVQAQIRQKLDEHAKQVEDKVRLHEPGWKDRYYRDKCKADDVEKHGGREHLFRSYVMGLCWVMKYYYDGCPSWKWYYPFHYAPFASDLKNIERFQNDCKSFEQNAPFNPIEQLMAVLPPDSSHAIPVASRWLMLDPESPINDFYPTSVPVDPNGKAMPWLWVVLLPFIEEERLLAAMSPTMSKWTKEELLCNARGMDDGYLYTHNSHPFANKLLTIVDGKTATAPKARLTDSASHGVKGLTGAVRPPLSHEVFPLGDEVSIPLPPNAEATSDSSRVFSDKLHSNEVVVAAFTEPPKLSHKSILLPGARPPPPSLKPDDKIIRRPRLNRFGGTIANMGGSGNNQSHQQGYGSMNISSQERQLAYQNGRGNQMNQPGTRSWGSMEPQQTYRRPLPPPMPQLPHVANPFLAPNRPNGQTAWQGQPTHAPPQPGMNYNMQQPQWQQQHLSQQYQQHSGANYRQQPQQQQYPPQYQQGAHQQRPGQWNQGYQSQQMSNMAQQQRPPQQSFNFRSYNASGGLQPPGYTAQQPAGAIRPRASADIMANLKQQLADTLNKTKR
ncbi:hypothetical protein MPSEU_000910000 [Mayamaea pseudoterrestris]|nr:hypothetical protein MPSEU_000910000 [Mayamaea pseudoterrestris]